MSGSVSTRTANRQAERVTASGQLRLPSCWGALPVKSSVQPIAGEHRAQAQLEVALRRLEHVRRRCSVAVGQRGQAGAGAPLGVVEHRVGGLAQARRRRGGARARTGAARRCGWRRAGRAGRRGARPAGACARRAPRSCARRAGGARSRRPPPARVRLSAGIDPGTRPPTSAWWARLAAKPSSSASANTGVIDGDVGQVGAAGERVVEDPGDARASARSPSTAATAAGIAPRCTGMCSACMTICAVGVEQRGGGVAALLDVRGVRRADQHDAHLRAGRAQGAGERPAARSGQASSAARRWMVPCASTSPHQPGG